MKKTFFLFVVLVLLLVGCQQIVPFEEQPAAEQPTAEQITTERFNMVGRWEMIGDIDGISYVFEFYPDHTGVTFASAHSFRDIMFYVEENDIRIDYYQAGEISVTEIMAISFDNEDQITLEAEGVIPITLVRVPLPDTPAFVRARVALLVQNEGHTIVSAEQEDEYTWYATVQVPGEEGTRLIKIHLEENGIWMPSEIEQ